MREEMRRDGAFSLTRAGFSTIMTAGACGAGRRSDKEMKKYLTIPNILTALRIVGAVGLLLVEPLSALFFAVYTFSGLTDALDGWVARKTGTASEFGAKLDSAADLLFYVVMMLRILPELVRRLPGWIWYWVGLIVLSRAALYAVVALRFHRFSSPHTYLNKLTGLFVFLIPYFTCGAALYGYSLAACVVGTLSSAEEWALRLGTKVDQPERKSIFLREAPMHGEGEK